LVESQKNISLKDEFFRKLIHLSSLVVPIAYLFLHKFIIVGLIVLGLIIAFVVEWSRQKDSAFSRWFYKWLGPLLRTHEKSQLTSSTYLIIGSLFTVLIFPKMIAIFSLFTLILSDALAAIVGRTWGRYKLYLNKTWEGTTTFFLCTLIISIFILDLPIWSLIVISALISIIELLMKSSFDNLVIPLASGSGVLLVGLLI